MFHQSKGVFFPGILRELEIKTSPRFDLAGKTQQELEAEVSPRRGKQGVTVYHVEIEENDGIHLLVWEKGERPVVWLTVEEAPILSIRRVENTNFQEAEGFLKGFFRIGIDTAKVEVFPWREYEQRARISKKWRRILAESARGDDTSKWYFSLTPIPSSAWTAVERWDASRWVPYFSTH